MDLSRRALLAAALAAPVGARVGGTVGRVPVVDRLVMTVLADNTIGGFGPTIEREGMRFLPPRTRSTDYRKTLRGEWGYSLLAEGAIGERTGRAMIDFGYSAEGLANNMALLGIDPATFDALVLSHGHYDHFGGLGAVLGAVREGISLVVGGEEALCARLRGIAPTAPSFGQLDREAVANAGVELVIDPAMRQLAGVGFTTGTIPSRSAERPRVPTSMLPGKGCRRDLLAADRRDADHFIDDAAHELGTVFHLKGRGLVVIGSCSHRGIVNTVLAARAVSGIERVHAVVGGFHLIPPQTGEDVAATVAMLGDIDPAFVFPGHCSGEAFIRQAQDRMGDRVISTVVGNRIELS